MKPTRGDAGIITKGLLIQMVVTMMLGVLFALVVPFLPVWVWGVLFGVLIWVLDVAGLLKLIDPTMSANFSMGLFFITHLVFGGVLGWWLQTLPIDL